jgi:hypothetical protein
MLNFANRLSSIALAVLLLLGMMHMPPAAASPATQAESPLLRMLNLIPSTLTLASEYIISYADYPALFAARPDGLWPADVETWEAFDDAQRRLFLATTSGVSAGMADLPIVLPNARDMREVTGIDPFTIGQSLEYGQPPAQGRVLFGQFDPKAIETTLLTRNYTAAPTDDLSLWCPADGCDEGLKVNLIARNPANPFGGKIGREELFAFDETRLLNSPALLTMNLLLATAADDGKSVSGLPEVRAAAEALNAQGAVLQAWLINSNVTRTFQFGRNMRLSPQQQEELLKRVKTQIESTAALPPYALVAFAHIGAGDHIRTVIALVYDSAADAEQAGQSLRVRIDDYQSLAAQQPFTKLLADRGATVEDPAVLTSDSTGRHVSVLMFRTPLEASEGTEGNVPPRSGAVFRLLVNMLMQRDTLWLASELVAPQ